MKKFVVFGILLLGIVLLAGCSKSITNQNQTNEVNNKQIDCMQDLKMCPDGSFVGRVGPSCEFATCGDVIKCSTNADCAAYEKMNICHAGVCTSPVSWKCSGSEDKSCPEGYQCAQICAGDETPPFYCQLNETVKEDKVCNAEIKIIR
jgi:hypothetical protein